MDKRWVRIIARAKLLQSRGGSWVYFITNIGVITANIALFKEHLTWTGLSLTQLLVIGAFAYFALTLGIGVIDEYLGIWKQENDYSALQLTSYANPMVTKIDEIHTLMKKNGDSEKSPPIDNTDSTRQDAR